MTIDSSTINPKVCRRIVLPVVVSVCTFFAMIVTVTSKLAESEKPRLIHYDLSVFSDAYFGVQPFLWPMFLGCVIWGSVLGSKREVYVYELLRFVGIVFNLAVFWLVGFLVAFFVTYHDSILRMEPNAPFL